MAATTATAAVTISSLCSGVKAQPTAPASENKPIHVEDYHALGTEPYHCHHCHTGRCPVGITTQDPDIMQRLDIEEGAERVANLLPALTSEIQLLARACGKADVHDLEPEDLRALNAEASMICGIPLAGTDRVWGNGPGWKERE